jgi:Holliday junction DNA helicase RuvB
LRTILERDQVLIRPKPIPAETDDEETAPPKPERNPNRPKSLDEVVGQRELLTQLRIVLNGAMMRDQPIPNILLSGPAGCGKTSLAEIISEAIGATLVPTTGMMLKKPSDLVALLVKTEGPTVLFVDEIHAMSKPAMECLYTVMEDRKIDLLSGSGADTMTHTHLLPHLVVVGATTRAGLLATPFRDRFGFAGVMSEYTQDELAQIVGRFWTRQGMQHAQAETFALAQRSKNVPRRALHLAARVLDYATVMRLDEIVDGTVANALMVFGIDENGLDNIDFKIVSALTKDFAGRTIGLDALALFLDLDAKTLADAHEPYLARAGLLIRAKTGRMATPAAYELTREEA